MTNTPANDAPYVIGAIEDAGTADYPGLQAAHVGGFSRETINPIVVNADGSFTAAYGVSAPSYFYGINLAATSTGTRSFTVSTDANSEYTFSSLTAASPGSITFALTGRDGPNIVQSVPLVVENGRVVITEAIRASFPPSLFLEVAITGLASNSAISGQLSVDLANFYDPAGATVTQQTVAAVTTFTTGGNGAFFVPRGLVESFTLTNSSVWTSPSTVFRLVINTPQALDLTGFTGSIQQNNVVTGGQYRSTITVTPVNGEVAVPPTILQQLQALPGSVVLSVSGAVVGTSPQVQATVQQPVTTITEGLYTQNFGADGLPTGEAVRVDAAANALLQDDDFNLFTMSRGGDGGLVIAWLGNDDTDGKADAVYVRKLDDTGNPVGNTVALSGLSAEAIAAISADSSGQGVLTGLADGGFAVAYTVEADEFQTLVSSSTPPTPISVTFSNLVGQLERVELTQFTPQGALSGSLRGEAPNGSLLTVNVAVVDGVFTMTDALRAQFAPGAHLSLGITGLATSSTYAALVTSRDIFDFDSSSALTTVSRTATASSANNGTFPDAFFGTGLGQTVSFRITGETLAAGQPNAYTLSLTSTQPLDLTGLTQYTGNNSPGLMTNVANAQFNGTFINTIVVTPVGGVVNVPAAILAQISGDTLRAVLGISGLQGGSTASADITVRQPSQITQPGVFTQTFDASGASEGVAQRIDDADATLPALAAPNEDGTSLAIHADADGGFRVTWIAGSNDASGVPRIVSKEFNATGVAVGTAIDISAGNIPGLVAASDAGADSSVPDHMQLVELSNGGFATLVQVEAINAFTGSVDQVSNGGPLFITSAQGRFTELVVFNPVPAASATVRYFIEGQDNGGNPLSIELFVEDGRVAVPESAAAQFSPTYFLNFRVDGLQAGSKLSGFTTAVDVWNYSEDSEIITSNGNWTVASFGGPPIGLAFAAQSQAIAFDIVQATAAAGQTPSYRVALQTNNVYDTASVGLPAQTFNSVFNVWEVSVAVTPNSAGHIDVPAAMLALTADDGGRILLIASGLANGSAFVTTTTERMPSSIVEEGLFVQLFNSAGAPTGDLIRVDDPLTSVANSEDNSQSSIQSDGAGGFYVIWETDTTGNADSDGIIIRHFNAAGQPIGETTSFTDIPDRIYDEGADVTLYTGGLFADPDPGDTLTFSATGLPDGLSIDSATGLISGSGNEAGLFAVTVTATDAGGLAASSNFDIFIEASVNSQPDINGDQFADILWRNQNGPLTYWAGTGTGFDGNTGFFFNVGTDWQIAGSGDVTGDGLADLVWRNANGSLTFWNGTGSGFHGNTGFSASVGTDWQIAGVADITADGQADILWRNTSGALTFWASTGSGFSGNTGFFTTVGSDWKVASLDDFDADGDADILWRNDNGALTYWAGTGTGFNGNTGFFANVGTDWQIADTADFNGDGLSDILWRNTNGALTVWTATGTGFVGASGFNGLVGTDWQIADARDYTGDGLADILWRNNNGALTYWESTGTGFDGNTGFLVNVGTDWIVQDI